MAHLFREELGNRIRGLPNGIFRIVHIILVSSSHVLDGSNAKIYGSAVLSIVWKVASLIDSTSPLNIVFLRDVWVSL